jgi:hypothetical protein
MSWRDTLFGGNSAASTAPRFPLGARLGGAVTIDETPFKILGAQFGFACPSNPQMIEAIGEIDLDEHGAAGSKLTRLYLTDDAFIQISTTNGQVMDVKLFVYDDTINPVNQSDFQAWVQGGSRLGQPYYELDDRRYERRWGDSATGESLWVPPIVFEERVYKTSPAKSDYALTLYSMLYERDIEGSERTEVLVVAAEDSGPNDFCISQALGTTLRLDDLDIT